MSGNEASANDRAQRRKELQDRLRKLTEERKAEWRRLGRPLPGDDSAEPSPRPGAVDSPAAVEDSPALEQPPNRPEQPAAVAKPPPLTPEALQAAVRESAARRPPPKRRFRARLPLVAAIAAGLVVTGGATLAKLGRFPVGWLDDGGLPAATSASRVTDSGITATPERTASADTAAENWGEGFAGVPREDVPMPAPTALSEEGEGGPAEAASEWQGPLPEERIRRPPELILSPDTPMVQAAERSWEIGRASLEPESDLVSPRAELAENPPPPEAPTAADRPAFIPFTEAPILRNPDELLRALEEQYPKMLRSTGVTGTVVLWLYIDEEGRVLRSRVAESSGYDLMDQAAHAIASKMEWKPAMNRDKKTAVWLAQPITFE